MADNLLLAARLEPQALDALAQYDLPAPSELQLLSFSENAVYRAGFPGQPPVVVRLHSLGYHDLPAIESELAWVEAVGTGTGVRTPAVLRSRQDETAVTAHQPGMQPRFAVVFEWLDGASPEGVAQRADYHLLGRTTAMLHDHVRGWPRPPRFSRFRWDLAGTIGHSPHWGHWQDSPHLDRDVTSLLARAADLASRRLAAFGQAPERFGLIHADLRLANLLIADGSVRVIDFDDCGFSWFLYDLASALTFMEDDPDLPQFVDAWLDGYREVRPLDMPDVHEIPTFLMLRRLVILAWLSSRPATELSESLGESYAGATAELAERYLATMSQPATALAKAIPWT
jgi:Ser/Thr protein kinase RdoA (MazF antagonist)